MKSIPDATTVILTEEERTELEALVRSTRTEYRLRQRAQIVLLAAEGIATRAIGREVGCMTGTASKWRVRYAERRLAGLVETGNRGNDPKYTAETGKRILAVLDSPAPKGYARWTGPLIASALGDVDVQYLALSARPEDRSCGAEKLVREQRPELCRQSRRNRWALSQSTGKCSGLGR